MQRRYSTRTLGVGAGAALLILSSLAPATASAIEPQSPQPAITVDACEVSDATFEWGTIERFRSYISGSIANGSWNTDGDVSYETPSFTWENGDGIVSTDGNSGEINASGTVQFSGHDGLLQVVLSNPTLELVDSEEAYLMLDLSSTNEDGEQDVLTEQERAVKLDIRGTSTMSDSTITFTEVPGQLTAEGAAAFNGFYAAGEPVDALTVTATATDGCVFAPAEDIADEEDPIEDEVTTQDAEEPAAPTEAAQTPWLPIAIGGAGLMVIAVAVTLLVTGRKRGDGVDEAAEDRTQ